MLSYWYVNTESGTFLWIMLYNFHVQDIIILLDVLSGLFIFKIVHYFSYLQSIHEYILVLY